MATPLIDRLRKRPPLAPPPGLVHPVAVSAPPIPAPPVAPPPSEPLGALEPTLAHAQARARRYGASARATSGRRVWVVPSRVSWMAGAYFLLVTGDAPEYADDGRPLEELPNILALRARLARGGLDPDAPQWRAEVLDEPAPEPEDVAADTRQKYTGAAARDLWASN